MSVAYISAVGANGQSVPANLAAVSGTIDVGMDVDARGIAFTATAIITAGADSIVQTQTVDATTGARVLHNGPATVRVTATTNQTPPGSISEALQFVLGNP